jgi:ketosteroid isomerase-like protein
MAAGYWPAMSEPDVLERARSFCESIERRDFDAALSLFGPDPVWDMSGVGLGPSKGRGQIRDLLEDWSLAYEEWQIAFDEFLDLGNEVVFAIVTERGRLVGSSAHLHLRYAVVAMFEDRKPAKISAYMDIEEARTAALAEARG